MKLILLVIISIFAVRYLFLPGFIPTHDGEFHFVRFWQFEKMLLSGDLFPIWAPDLNSGYGLPLFYYHYPLPNYFGVLFHLLGFSYTDAFKLTLASFYLISIVFFYVWSRNFWAAIIFGWTPYWFVNLFVRGSIGEVMAMAGFAFVLWAIRLKRNTLAVLGVAFIILSHNISAMLFIPLALWLNWRSAFWGILLAAYFWLPAVTGGAYVQGLSNINFADHFSEISQLIIPSWGTGFSRPGALYDEMSQQLGLGTLTVSLATMPGSFIVVLIAFMTTAGSRFIWDALPVLQLVQYPWRLLMFVPFIAGSLAIRLPRLFVVIIAAISILSALAYTKPVVYEPRSDEYYLSRREFTDGTSSLGNGFSTRWTPWKGDRASDKIEILEGSGTIKRVAFSPTKYNFTVDAFTPVTIRVNTVYFPGWEAKIDQKREELTADEDGLMRIRFPSGESHVKVELHSTWLRQTALAISLVSFIWLLRSGILKQ